MKQDWRLRAECRDAPIELFFTDDEEDARNRSVQRQRRRDEVAAKALCRECPVRVQCELHAAREPEQYGIWGGLTAQERHDQKRRA